MNQVGTRRGDVTINGVPVSRMDEEEARRKLREVAKDLRRVQREKEDWRKKARRYMAF